MTLIKLEFYKNYTHMYIYMYMNLIINHFIGLKRYKKFITCIKINKLDQSPTFLITCIITHFFILLHKYLTIIFHFSSIILILFLFFY